MFRPNWDEHTQGEIKRESKVLVYNDNDYKKKKQEFSEGTKITGVCEDRRFHMKGW